MFNIYNLIYDYCPKIVQLYLYYIDGPFSKFKAEIINSDHIISMATKYGSIPILRYFIKLNYEIPSDLLTIAFYSNNLDMINFINTRYDNLVKYTINDDRIQILWFHAILTFIKTNSFNVLNWLLIQNDKMTDIIYKLGYQFNNIKVLDWAFFNTVPVPKSPYKYVTSVSLLEWTHDNIQDVSQVCISDIRHFTVDMLRYVNKFSRNSQGIDWLIARCR